MYSFKSKVRYSEIDDKGYITLGSILDYFQKEKTLSEHLVLKGGTAINLTIFPLLRLSVDIDMDYIPNDSKDDMMITRQNITNIVGGVKTGAKFIVKNQNVAG